MDSVELLEDIRSILYKYLESPTDVDEVIDLIIKDIERLEKALDIACEKLEYTCPVEEELTNDLDCDDCSNNCKGCWKIYFLKEVLKLEKYYG